MESIIRMFKAGLPNIKIVQFYCMTIGKISAPGLEYKLKKELGIEEYKRIQQEWIKHPKQQERYKNDEEYKRKIKLRTKKRYELHSKRTS